MFFLRKLYFFMLIQLVPYYEKSCIWAFSLLYDREPSIQKIVATVPQPLAVFGSGLLLLIIFTALCRKYVSYFPINLVLYIGFGVLAGLFLTILNASSPTFKFAYFSLLCSVFALYLSAVTSYGKISMQSNVFFLNAALIYAYQLSFFLFDIR